jgi:hypothetical protein
MFGTLLLQVMFCNNNCFWTFHLVMPLRRSETRGHGTKWDISASLYDDDFTILNENINTVAPLTPELSPSAQRCLARFFTENFAS